MDLLHSSTWPDPDELWFRHLMLPAFGLAALVWVVLLAWAWGHDPILWTLPCVGWYLCSRVTWTILLELRDEELALLDADVDYDTDDADFGEEPACYDGPDGPGEDMFADFTPQLDLQEEIRQFVSHNPEYERRLNEIIAWEKLHPPDNAWDGWEWHDTHTAARLCTQLVQHGFLSVVYNSRSSTNYRLVSLPDTEEAMANLRVLPQPDQAPDLSGLFRFVVGHDRAKLVALAAIESEKPVHVLFLGPPGTAKTLMLTDIGGLPDAEFYAGSTTTGPGLVNLLLSKRPRYLVIDEVDKMATEDMAPLLNLMEGGVVTRLQVKHQQRETMDTRVFAGGNDIGKLSAPILSRFARVHIPAYTPAEFVSVAQAVLVQREGVGPQVALHIATALVPHSTDIRDAVRVARLCRGKAILVEPTVASLFSEKPGQLPFGAR